MEEREIDLLDMIADILSHWRGLVVALVIGAVLMGGLSYVKSYQNIQNIQNAQPIEEETTPGCSNGGKTVDATGRNFGGKPESGGFDYNG